MIKKYCFECGQVGVTSNNFSIRQYCNNFKCNKYLKEVFITNKYYIKIKKYLNCRDDIIAFGADEEYEHFIIENSIGIDLSFDEVVFINDKGDYLHIDMNETTLYLMKCIIAYES